MAEENITRWARDGRKYSGFVEEFDGYADCAGHFSRMKCIEFEYVWSKERESERLKGLGCLDRCGYWIFDIVELKFGGRPHITEVFSSSQAAAARA